ncbi:hypothetical protein IM792_18815 [Mucilaginibacter sp. JRF]|uniref:hypothetical protein n=1 Tax=Mucilaginibacter sp. JRF TaxID=2780088 RepID=UPI00187F50E2|nr:hypothetical protein [Mucilaginibacter sp. JRF]MBE9586508.1 hypothetical protein [Mucilaginibacter sp. JRF]
MKNKFTLAAMLLVAVCLTNCKKDNPVAEENLTPNNDGLVMAASGVPVHSVTTIAGSPYTSGQTLVNANGKNARFNNPFGIQLMADGTIYVADTDNKIIRVVSPTADVTSLNIPNHDLTDPSFWLKGPKYFGMDDNGAVYIIDYNPDYPHDRALAYKKDGSILGGTWSDFYDMKDIVKDPFGNAFYSTFGNQLKRITMKQSNTSFYDNNIDFTNYFLPDDPGYYTFPAIFMGNNGVIYFVYKGKLYKRSKDGSGAPIFPNLTFNDVTCIMANKDSRTLYIADKGYIRRIDNGKLTTITGPNTTYNDSRDGIGIRADVYAKYMALSKDESTIYFSDPNADAIRKIVLR